MDAGRFDCITTMMATDKATSRRAMVRGLLVGGLGIVAGERAAAATRKRCKKDQTGCQGKCVNTNTDSKNCGRCGNRCANGEQCLNGRCFSDDTCPVAQEACPNFRRCGIEDRDCFCGTTTGGASICFQDENFCESPRPCQNNQDCDGGRVCIDSSLCCAARNLPEVPRTCVLPCENPSETSAKSGKSARKSGSGSQGPGSAGE